MKTFARTQKKHWVISPASPEAQNLAKSLKVSNLVAQVLINRGITEQASCLSFLKPKLTGLFKPERMPGVTEAMPKIKEAIEKHQKITLYGDYDVDGITGISILWQILKLVGADVDFYIPHRLDEGYGLNEQALSSIAKNGTKLLITIDCGITAVEAVAAANGMKMDVIVTDHHHPGPELPEAAAIVHPALDEKYPNQDSCGALVAYKLAWAIANEFNPGARLNPELRRFMLNATSLAAIGTVADVVDLRGENRIVTSYGLKSLPHCELPGIQALIETAELLGRGLDSYHIGFRLAPMLNAAGRMGHARLAVELLTSDSKIRAMQIGQYLKEQNEKRRSHERRILRQACELVTQRGLNHPDRKTIFLAGEMWHGGVVGIVASRIAEKYFRPTVMIDTSESIARGSARSIPGFDLFSAISACSEYLDQFGGHEMAAGVTLSSENVEPFAAALEEYAGQYLSQEDIIDKLNIDAEVKLSQLREKTVCQLEKLEPFGQGNPRPVFASRGVRLAAPPRTVGARNDHLQLVITDNATTVRCIGFRMGKLEKKLLENDYFNIAYEPQMNHYNGSSHVQFVISDISFD